MIATSALLTALANVICSAGGYLLGKFIWDEIVRRT